MDLPAVIVHLRANAPIFGGRVAGAANFTKALETEGMLDLPAAYVVPADDDATENLEANLLVQDVTERFSVIVELPNDADRRGQRATTLYDPVRAALWAALLNWRLDPVKAAKGLYYAGGSLLDLDRARLFYRWDFAQDIRITDEDGWQQPLIPLTSISFTTSQPPFEADVALPQE